MPIKRRRKRPAALILGGLFYATVCAAALGLGSVAGWLGQSSVATHAVRQLVLNTTPEEVFHGRRSINVLVLGCDEDRSPGGKKVVRKYARSDMMLVAKLDFEANRITGVSIPRDTLAEVPGYRAQKINAYHALGGKELSMRAVERLLAIPIDRAVVIDYDAFQQMVDLVGGVEVFVPKRLKYTDRRGGLFIDLKKGRQHLNGYDAMCFVRYRHSDSDFERQQRQKDLLMSFRDTVLAKPQMLTSVAEKAIDVLGGALTPEEIAAVSLFCRRVGSDSIQFGMVPVVEVGGYNLRIDERELRKVLATYHFVDGGATSYSVRR